MPPNINASTPHPARTVTIVVIAVAVLGAFAILSMRDRGAGIPPEISEELTPFHVANLRGTITAITAEGFTLDVPEIMAYPIPEAADLRYRTVRVGSETTFLEIVRKSPEAYAEELDRYRRTTGEVRIPPSYTTMDTIASASLKVGDVVTVRGSAGQDLTYEAVIIAMAVTRHVE